jgi:hypothetical protein
MGAYKQWGVHSWLEMSVMHQELHACTGQSPCTPLPLRAGQGPTLGS